MNQPLDRVEIRGLTVTTIVGVLAHEREIAQPLRLDLDLHLDLHDAGRSDDLADTANYGDIAERVADAVRGANALLLERVADLVAEVAFTVERVEAVDVTVTKLRPPIPEQLDSTAVHIHRRRTDPADAPVQHRAYLALGSNLGDREGHLRLALRSLPGVVAASQVFETDPVGGPDGQGAYLNMVVAVDTTLDPYALLRRCHHVESLAHRERSVRWGPRTLDVDLIMYDDVCIDDPQLTLPHPRYHERRFVLAPLSELAPERCPAGWDEDLPAEGVHPRGPLVAGSEP